MLGGQAFFDEYIEPKLTGFIAARFEAIGRAYFSLLAKSGKLPGARNIGSLYYDDPVNKRNGEFDIAIAYSDHYDIVEVKYYIGALSIGEMRKEAAQVMAIPDISIGNIGFLSAGGFQNGTEGFSPCLTAEDLYAGEEGK